MDYKINLKIIVIVIVSLLPVLSQTWQDDSLVVRQILDTNGLYTVSVDSVVYRKDSTGRASWLIIFKLPSFQVLPASIEQLDKLVRINISHTNLASIPSEIGNLALISILNLYDNKLTSLPPEIGDIDSLLSLNISCNAITAIPPEIGKLKKLYQLNFGENKITHIPDEFCNFTSSKMNINAENNLITSVPEDIGFLSLKHLRLEYNKLKHIPNSLTNHGLNVVNVCYNDSLVFTDEQKAAWDLIDYDQYFFEYCEVSAKEDTFSKNQTMIAQVSICGNKVSLRVNYCDHVFCAVYDVRGRDVETLVNGSMSAGTHNILWNRAHYAPGVYFVRYSTGDGHSFCKTVIIK